MLPKPDLLPQPFPTKAILLVSMGGGGGCLWGRRARTEVAPAQGAIPGILRFGTKNSNVWVEGGDTLSWGWCLASRFPLQAKLGALLSLALPPLRHPLPPSPPLPGRLGASGEGGGALRRCPECCLAGDCSVLHLCLSPGRHLGLQLWQRVGPRLRLASGSERSPCLFLCLSPTPGVLRLSPAVSVFPWPCSLSPSLLVWLGVGPTIHLWITLHFGLQVPCLWWGWGSSVSPPLPLHPSLSLISPLARPPPSVSLLSQAPRISISLESSASSPDRLPAPGGPDCPLSWGRGRGRGKRVDPSPGPGPATPLPTSLAL